MGFELNREYIAAELCVNRDVPESGCNGHCYLMKKLKQAQKDSQGTDKPGAKRETFWQHCADLTRRPVLLPLRETLRAPFAFSGHVLQTPASVFHPPQEFSCIGNC